MPFDPIAIALAFFVLFALLVPAPAHWRRHPPARGAGAPGVSDSL